MKTALIFTSHKLSAFAHPNALRLVNFASILKELGYETKLYGADPDLEASGELRGFEYEDWKLGRGRKARRARYATWKARVDAVFAKYPQPDLIISGVNETQSARLGAYLARYARKRKIPFAKTLVEWFSLSNFSGFGRREWARTSPYKNFLLHEYTMRFVNPRFRNLIVISSYLERYYRAKECSVLTIPTIVDPREYANVERRRTPDGKTRVLYAGSPRRKDAVMNAILGLAALPEDARAKLELHFYGPEESELQALGLSRSQQESLKDALFFHGRVPYEQVKQEIADADFTILLRKNCRNANAGFSTKVGESMACGTPVIANLTSDLNQCLFDGRTGVLCASESVEDCQRALLRAIQYSQEELAAMRANCLKTAAAYFDYRVYVEPMREFLTNLQIAE